VRILSWAATIVAAVILTCFAVSNRQAASLALWPLPYAVGLPLYLMVFASLAVGAVAGLFGAWFGARHRRRELRRRGRRIEALERELAAAQSRLEAGPAEIGRSAVPARAQR
jgi:uncharacterized integral membrane protein